jgi:anti-anti-sigma factor
MAASQLEATVRHENDASVIDLKGEINGFAEATLNTAYQEATEKDTKIIVLNFENVSYMNSTGIALIVGLLAQARKSHRELRVFGLTDHYIQIFEITRLVDFMSIHQDEKSALV